LFVGRALTLAGDEAVTTEAYLSERIRQAADFDSPAGAPPATIRDAAARVARNRVEDALRKSGGNRSEAARLLGLTHQGLLNKIRRYKIEI